MTVHEREILERAVSEVTAKAAEADAIVQKAYVAGLDRSAPATIAAKMLRKELLVVNADLDRELETWVIVCSSCCMDVHWVAGPGVSPGHRAHRDPAPHGEPTL